MFELYFSLIVKSSKKLAARLKIFNKNFKNKTVLEQNIETRSNRPQLKSRKNLP